MLSDIDFFLLLEYKKFRPTFYTNLFWISRHRNANENKPFLYPRVNGTDMDNIEIYNDLAFSLFSGDIGTRFALGEHKIKLQYNYSNNLENMKQNYEDQLANHLTFHTHLGEDYQLLSS